MLEEQVDQLLPLAAKIAREFSNIPGLPHAEIEITAQEALVRAARSFDPAKGDFTPYAATAMRNALRDLHERQCRHHRHHFYDLDQPATTVDSQAPPRIERVPGPETFALPNRAAFRESSESLEQALVSLPPRLRRVAEGIREGKTYREIGDSLGISKQAAHKIAHAAIASLREKLAAMGYGGLDTLGLLKSCGEGSPHADPEAVHHSKPPAQVDDPPSDP